jgi:DNA-binding CsgD family transcriptional regulator
MKFFDLTPTEIQIADLVRKDKTTKEIAQILNASEKTIEAHRNRLRKKLGLTNQRIQLRDYLMTLV